MPKQIVGNVHWIENGKQTNRLVDVQEAFTDLDQAKTQVLFAEASGDKRADQARKVGLSAVPGDAISGRKQGQAKKGYQGGSAKGIKDSKVSEIKVRRQDSGKKVRKEDCQEEVVRQEACPYRKWRTILTGRTFRSTQTREKR